MQVVMLLVRLVVASGNVLRKVDAAALPILLLSYFAVGRIQVAVHKYRSSVPMYQFERRLKAILKAK